MPVSHDKPKVLVQLDADPHPSVFDSIVAVDAGVDQLLRHAGVRPEDVRALVYGAIFTRGVEDLHRTAVFIGGSDATAGEALLAEVCRAFLGPLRVSVMLDSGGSNTTAAAAVRTAQHHLPLRDAVALVLGGSGSVGRRIVRLLAGQGAVVRVSSIALDLAQAACRRVAEEVPSAGDLNTALSVLLLTKLSAEPVYYGDLQHINKQSGEIKIIGDGACPPSLAGRLGPAGFAEHGIPTEGEAGGLSVKLVCKVGEGVLARLGRVDGRFTMVITRCSIFEPSAAELPARQRECGIPFWPHGFVTAHCDMDELLEHWTNEYACLGYGAGLYDDLVDFCKMTGIEAILP